MSGFNLTARTASEALPILADQIMRNGALVESRAGTTRELLYPHITLTEPWKREILTPHRKADIVAQIVETVWVLSGRNDIAYIQPYLKRAGDFSDDGSTWRAGYGPRLRNWYGVDQIQETVDLLKQDLETRRAVMSLWNPEEDYAPSKDIPCNNWLHFLVRDGKLNLHVVIRSNDLIWGWSGINAFEWSVLQELVASMIGVGIGTLEFSISSLHIYERHFKKATEICRTRFDDNLPASPRTKITSVGELDQQLKTFISAERGFREGTAGDVNLDSYSDSFFDPMIKSWLKVVQAYWKGEETTTDERLQIALDQRPRSSRRPDPVYTKVVKIASNLHTKKHEVYGDSWKKRGEQVSIQANIARKIDRLGKAGAGDDNLDTSIDLLNYLTKYALWLEDENTDGPEHAHMVADELQRLSTWITPSGLDVGELESMLTAQFEDLLELNDGTRDERHRVVLEMRRRALELADLRYKELRENHPIIRSSAPVLFVNDGDNGPNYERA